jgi:hypothetical protein
MCGSDLGRLGALTLVMMVAVRQRSSAQSSGFSDKAAEATGTGLAGRTKYRPVALVWD